MERSAPSTPFRPPAISGVGIFAVFLGTVILLLVGGLYIADRALREGAWQRADHDAREVALLLEEAIVAKTEVLSGLRGLFTAGATPPDSSRLAAILDAPSTSRQGIERLWVTDAAGVVLHDTLLVVGVERAPATPAEAAGSLMERALRDGRFAIGLHRLAGRAPWTTRDGGRRLVFVEPLVLRGRVVGLAVATVVPDALLPDSSRVPSAGRVALVVRAGVDTVLVQGDLHEGGRVLARADARVDGRASWRVDAVHEGTSVGVQRALWFIGTLAVVFLALGLLRERRQAVRIAERSSELERLSSELLRANRMKSEFLANVSHELRTPLNAIVGFVELLRDGVYGELSPRQTQPVERIAASASHLRHLVDQVLDIAKIAAGRLEVHPEPIILRPFVINVVGELESLVAEKGLSMSIGVGASLPRVRTDPAHLRQILINLVGNAVKYTEAGGIVVRARLVGARRPHPVPPAPGAPPRPIAERTTPEDATLVHRAPRADHPWIALQVIDTGIGVAVEDRERIFDEFEQVNAGPRGESMRRGTGLGLAISRRLARLIGGDITVDSEVGKGSTFTIWLPVSAAELSTPPAVPAVPTPAVGAPRGES
jgi:signal transduction histidine kinase